MPAALPAVAPDSASALLRRQRSGEVRGAYAYDEEPTEDMQVRFGANSRLLGERLRPSIDDEMELSVALTHEAEYAFDVAGHLRLRGLLGEQQLKALNAALDRRAAELVALRRSLGELNRTAELQSHTASDGTAARRLVLDGAVEVSVVYYRAGYTPDDYPSEAQWDARLLVERSAAVKCPSIDYHLTGNHRN